jgi:hypothetical protein
MAQLPDHERDIRDEQAAEKASEKAEEWRGHDTTVSGRGGRKAKAKMKDEGERGAGKGESEGASLRGPFITIVAGVQMNGRASRRRRRPT